MSTAFRHVSPHGNTTAPVAVLRCWAVFMLVSFISGSLLPSPVKAQEPIKIGVSLGLTGRFSVMSDALQKGFRLWERHVNAGGGILGRPVLVICEDDHGSPETARSLYVKLIETDKVDFLFAPYSSMITEAVLPIAQQHKIPILVAGAAADRLWEQGFNNVIGVYPPASKFTIGFLELLVLNDLDGIAIVYSDDSFSVDLAKGTRDWSQRFGLHLVLFEGFEKGTENLDFLAIKAREKGAAVLMVCGHMNESVNMTLSLKRIDWRPRAYYASVGPAFKAFHDRCGEEAERVFATSLWEPQANYPGARKFERDFIATYRETPGYHAGLAYAAGQVLAETIKEAGSVDRERVRNLLFRLDTMTVIGRFGVDRTGKQVRQQAFIIQWQNGQKEVVWPEAIKTAEPRF
jgi:branched-chain amino acid transport system substrate-binding protein